MAAPRVSFSDKDLENGQHPTGNHDRSQSRKWSQAPGNLEDLDEYTALQKYISTYRDPKAAAEEDPAKNAKDAGKGKSWWQFWRSGTSKNAGAADDGVVPEDWLEADIKQGISNHDVESRRKRFGYNEITTEKENLFIKFLMFFTGPILYGKSTSLSISSSHITADNTQRNAFICYCMAYGKKRAGAASLDPHFASFPRPRLPAANLLCSNNSLGPRFRR